MVRAGSCTVAASGVAPEDLGSWSKRYGWVWAARFTRVRAPGRYRFGILGDASAASPWFTIGAAAQLYARPLANALYFYENERDGPDFIHTALRSAPGHLNDLSAMTYRSPPVDGNGNFKGSLAKYATGVRINASGGWFDAGDYLHFVETTSYSRGHPAAGHRLVPGADGLRGRGSPARIRRHGLHRRGPVRAGLPAADVAPADQDAVLPGRHRRGEQLLHRGPRHLAAAPGRRSLPGLESARRLHPAPAGVPGREARRPDQPEPGRLAADFALCYQVFRHSDPGYAANCLREAETVYAQAGTHWKGQLLTALPWDFYPETSWRDDMMLGATELARALQEAGHPAGLPAGLPVRSAATYLRDAAGWASAWVHSKQALSDTLNLYDVSALADYELDLALARQPVRGLAITRAQLLANLRGQIQKGIARRPGRTRSASGSPGTSGTPPRTAPG